MVDPSRSNRFVQGMKTSKSDRLDAEAIAMALARGLLDTYRVRIPDDDTRLLREVARARRHLVNDNTALRNRARRDSGADHHALV